MEQNNLDALKERLEGRKKILACMNGVGRADSISLQYFDRGFIMPLEQPDKYKEAVDAFKKCLEADIADFEKLVAEGETIVKEFADKKAAEVSALEDKRAEQEAEEAATAAEAQKKRIEQEEQMRLAQLTQELEKAKQEELRTRILEAELASKNV